jgi:hypothetical protein
MLGVICGLGFGALAVATMLPMSFRTSARPSGPPSSTASLSASRSAVRLPWPGWAVGLGIGALLSLPDAIITKAVAPILGMGAVGGLIVGAIVERLGR